MAQTYLELLNEYRQLYDKLPQEIMELINWQNEYQGDNDIQSILEYLNQEDVQYVTYTHS